MAIKTAKKAKAKRGATSATKLLDTILEEIRLLRSEVNLLLPHEDLEDYAHADRITVSYKKALKKHPPVSA